MRPRTAALVVAAAGGLTAVTVATTLTGPGFGAAAPPKVAHPNPAVSNITIDYAASPRGPTGQAAHLGPLSPAVLKPAIADQAYLAYQTAGDLGGFKPAPIGHLALSSGGHAVVGGTVKAQIPHYAKAGEGKINSFALIGLPAPSTTPPDNGLQPVPGLGIPAPTPPATTTAPPPNQGFAGTPATVPTTTATTPAPPATTKTQPPGTTTTARPPTTTGTTTAPPPATTTTGTPTTPSTTTAVTTTAAITTTSVTTTAATTTSTTTTTTTTRASGGSSGGSSSGGGTTTTTTSSTSCGTTGLSITSDHSSCRITATNMAPGGSASEVMTIKNESDTAYKLYLRATGTQNRLWNDLELGVWKTATAAPNPLPPLLNWTSQDNDLGITLQPGDTVKLTLELFLKSTAGNADQNLTATIDFVWKAIS